MAAAGRFLVALPLIGLLAWASVAAFGAGHSDVLLAEARTEISTWAASRSIPHQETWESVRSVLKEAERAQPRSPAPREALGNLGSLWAVKPEQIADGIAEFVAALRYRPVSAFTWAGIVEGRYRAGSPGRELELPITRAAGLGPSEPGVQRIVADYGLAVWSEITPATQTVVERMLAAGMRRNPLELLQISERRGRLDLACRHLADSSRKARPQVNRLCPSWEP
jgi:hypothetical protein